jgi:hypothetical protein
MPGIGKRISAAIAVPGVVGLLIGVGVSNSNADDSKNTKPQNTQPAPQLPLAAPGEFGKTQEQLRRAMESFAKNPNDPAARKMLDEALAGVMKGMPGDFPGIANPAHGHDRPRLGVRLEPMSPSVANKRAWTKGSSSLAC